MIPPRPKASLRDRMSYLSEEWTRTAVLEHRAPYFLNRVLGRRATIRFASGLVLNLDRANSDLGRKLVYFASLGASWTAPPPSSPRQWLLLPEENLLVTPSGIRFTLDSFDPLIFAETFLFEIHYPSFDLGGRIVVDVGSNVGDSPLYFASLGARVLAYEPDPTNFQRMLKNLEINPDLKDRIHPFNLAVGVDGTVPFLADQGGSSRVAAAGGPSVSVRSVSLDTIFSQNGIDHADLLKADCKGCEFDLVNQPSIRRFDCVAIEYSAALRGEPVDLLLHALRRAGFDRLHLFKFGPGNYDLDQFGMIHGERAGKSVRG